MLPSESEASASMEIDVPSLTMLLSAGLIILTIGTILMPSTLIVTGDDETTFPRLSVAFAVTL
jgi:hypothetical protein